MELDPWGPMIGLLFEDGSADRVLGVLQRSGIQISAVLSEREGYSHTMRKRAYKERADAFYSQLVADDKRRITRNIAAELSQTEPRLERLNDLLNRIGWELRDNVLEPLTAPSGEMRSNNADQHSHINNLPQQHMPNESKTVATGPCRKIFIVHGHDSGPREAVARYLEKLGFEAIILQEQANRGRTIIEKVEAHGDVTFAVVLLTPDDIGSKLGDELRPRPRQNVIVELGYFIGRLHRSRVCALSTSATMELPTDFAGVVWEIFDSHGGWKGVLVRELRAAGFEIDMNKIV